ncbi:protoporphyrinogen/coproporphyrinogen oxidase [Rhodothermus marinus]|uniref:protoporphyrinogen/coproporphyrinogen oxidase n=1 Tax=Rhodothermus marinus TaxID=29549 RepID=UPI001375383E|nr:NAD(P)/FAD-dependent oxidoreductase [Rhodothermus marinus]
MTSIRNDPEVIVVGAGLAGLRCAGLLHAQGIDVLLLERQDQVGGRVRTDQIDGFQLDRGFQVLQTAYPAAQRAFDYEALDLRPFPAGAYVFTEGCFQPFFDPLRHPEHLWGTLRSGLFGARDLFGLLKLGRRLETFSMETAESDDAEADRTTTRTLLETLGFSEAFIRRFWQPFLRGVFLETTLETRASKFFFVMKAFREGEAALPARGMQALPDQLAARLPAETIRTGCTVTRVEPDGTVQLQDGTTLRPRITVLAVDAAAMIWLWPDWKLDVRWNQSTTVYFAADSEPPDVPDALLLEGDPDAGPVATAAALHRIAPSYAPAGSFLLAATMPGFLPDRPAMAFEVALPQLRRWFGPTVNRWQALACYPIRHALPAEPAGWQPPRRYQLSDKVWCCGDYFGPASIQGALWHAERVAEQILAQYYG